MMIVHSLLLLLLLNIEKIHFAVSHTFLTEKITSFETTNSPQPTTATTGGFVLTMRKCCASGQAMKLHNGSTTCMDAEGREDWKPPGWLWRTKKPTEEPHLDFSMEFAGEMECQTPGVFVWGYPHQGSDALPKIGMSPLDHIDVDLRLTQDDGGDEVTLWWRVSGNDPWQLINSTYCMDGLFRDDDKNTNTSSTFPDFDFVVLNCKVRIEPVEKVKLFYRIYSGYAGFRGLSPLLHVIVYGLLWKEQNLHGWTVVMFSACAFFSSILSAGGITITLQLIWQQSWLCVAFAVSSVYFTLAAATWLTLISFDIMATLRLMTAKSARSKGYKRFGCYCLVGFGLPAIITGIGLCIDFSFGFWDDSVIRPQFGYLICGDMSQHAGYTYLCIIPLTVLFVVQLIFAVLAVSTVWQSHLDSKKITSSKTNQNSRTQARRIGKLLILTGATGIFECVFRLVTLNAYWAAPVLLWIRLALLVWEILTPWLIFYMFVWRREIRNQLSNKFLFFQRAFDVLDKIGWDVCAKKKNSRKENSKSLGSSQKSNASTATEAGSVSSLSPPKA